ncbi:hypothetical protein [Maribacter polysaccharolyticus]|uniref:hypothetical protein n=1 Tax=Maribacter polysaccharolyticus TaxID=3020831 RepID=UPI00237F2540|nr:hypothetical protein [Maribacter polysaccharolyticus]MDE3741558.1 hypothetical protein [Maribacter polysaccharolyticus]
MKNNRYISLIILLAFGLMISSCSDDDSSSDASEVIPYIFDFDGDAIAYVGTESVYSVTPRGGSEYVWTVTGADATVVTDEDYPEEISVSFTEFGTATISVYEIASNGLSSEVETMEVTVLGTPCTWTIDMQDSWGDGWNGAFLTFSFDGTETVVELADGDSLTETIGIPDGSSFEISFTSGSFDEEVSFQIYDASGTLVYEDGPTPATGVIYSDVNDCP